MSIAVDAMRTQGRTAIVLNVHSHWMPGAKGHAYGNPDEVNGAPLGPRRFTMGFDVRIP